jgi:hypothetical protein
VSQPVANPMVNSTRDPAPKQISISAAPHVDMLGLRARHARSADASLSHPPSRTTTGAGADGQETVGRHRRQNQKRERLPISALCSIDIHAHHTRCAGRTCRSSVDHAKPGCR